MGTSLPRRKSSRFIGLAFAQACFFAARWPPPRQPGPQQLSIPCDPFLVVFPQRGYRIKPTSIKKNNCLQRDFRHLAPCFPQRGFRKKPTSNRKIKPHGRKGPFNSIVPCGLWISSCSRACPRRQDGCQASAPLEGLGRIWFVTTCFFGPWDVRLARVHVAGVIRLNCHIAN